MNLEPTAAISCRRVMSVFDHLQATSGFAATYQGLDSLQETHIRLSPA